MHAWKTADGNYLIEREKQYYLFDPKGSLLQRLEDLTFAEKEILFFSTYQVQGDSLVRHSFEGIDGEAPQATSSKVIFSCLTPCLPGEPSFLSEVESKVKEAKQKSREAIQKQQADEKKSIADFIASLPDPSQINSIELIWDAEGSEGSPEGLKSVIRDAKDGSVLWKDQAYYGEHYRYKEIYDLLKQKYGEKLKSFSINHQNYSCSLYYYGD